MSFMQPEIYVGHFWGIDTTEGVYYVPAEYGPDVCRGLNESHIRIYSVERSRGVLGRLSAPGYMDCTDWAPYNSVEDAESDLASDDGGDDDDSPDPADREVRIYKSGGAWCYAIWYADEYDTSGELGIPDNATTNEAREEAVAQFGPCRVVRIADVTADGEPY